MQSALRPYVTAGVALVGASAIAVSPVTVPPSAVEKVQDAAVELSALDNPIDTLRPIFEQALREAREVGATIADNPAPILEQLLKNQVGNFVGLPAAIGAQLGVPLQLPQILGDVGQNELANLGNIAVLSEGLIANIVATLTSTDPTGLQGSLLSAFEAIGNNDLGSAFQFLFTAALVGVAGNGLETLTNLILLGQTLGEPVEDAAKLLPIVGGPLNNVASVIEALPGAALGVGIGPILSAGGAAETIGDDVSDIITAAQAGDAEAAFNHFVALSGVTTKVTLDSLVGPLGVLAGLQTFREAIAAAITPPASTSEVSKLPSATTNSFTLTAPAEKALPAPKTSTPSVDEKSGAIDAGAAASGTDTKDTSGQATPTNTKDNLKGGNLFTPGATSTKGGRHRADTGSFAQGLRDTIKGLTGLGHDKKPDKETPGTSASTSGESGSSSSGSGDSGSGGDSGSK